VLRFTTKSALAVLLTAAAIGIAGCSGGPSSLPGTGPQSSFDARKSDAHRPRPGSIQHLVSPPSVMQMAWLMTDGTVLAQSASSPNDFYSYAPDSSGSYADGTWKQVGSLPAHYAPSAGASAVMIDGRFAFVGGEYNYDPGSPSQNYQLQLTNKAAIYDPVSQKWTALGHPKGWDWIGDSPSIVLPNGNYLVGDKLHTWLAYLNPKTLTWKKVKSKGKADFNSEEGWTLLANGTILTADVKDTPNTEIYNPANGTWTSAGDTPQKLGGGSPFRQCIPYGPKTKDCYLPPGEIGPALLRPDGTVFATGDGESGSGYGDGHTAIYNSLSGGWSSGPNFPNSDNAGDNFGVLEPSGNVLIFGDSGNIYEFNGSSFSTISNLSEGAPILLPTGQVLILQYSSAELYTPKGSPQSSWAPTIGSSYPTSLSAGQTYKISGTQFNGLSQAMAFGDEYQNGTNYPLVQLTMSGSGKVYYLRTHDHSTMGVATGSQTVSTNFDVPSSIPSGSGTLVVIANGIASQGVSVTVSGSRSRHKK
jgi:hypothetical protein